MATSQDVEKSAPLYGTGEVTTKPERQEVARNEAAQIYGIKDYEKYGYVSRG